MRRFCLFKKKRAYDVRISDWSSDVCSSDLQLAQVWQACFEVAQLGVVEATGDFLAVAGDERHGRAFVGQRDGGFDLGGAGADLVGDGGGDLACQRGGKGLYRVRNPCGVAKPALSLRDAGGDRLTAWRIVVRACGQGMASEPALGAVVA